MHDARRHVAIDLEGLEPTGGEVAVDPRSDRVAQQHVSALDEDVIALQQGSRLHEPAGLARSDVEVIDPQTQV